MLGWLVVQVGRDQFALPLAEVREVVRGAWPERLPRAPFGCLGALNVRGERYPLTDLGVLAGLRRPWRPQEVPARLVEAHVVILEEEPRVALVVDRVVEVSSSVDAPEGAVPLRAATVLTLRRRGLLGRAVAGQSVAS